MKLKDLIKKTKKELFFKSFSSLTLRALLLVIPYYWSNCINLVTEEKYLSASKLAIDILILSLLYYLWNYINQRTWYTLHNKVYMIYTNNIIDSQIDTITLGEYTNIINNDVDVIGTFLCNSITRFFQIVEFLVIYIYFFSVNVYIFLITIIISILLIIVIFYLGSKIEVINKDRKENLDYKTINIHNIYDIMKKNKKVNFKEFFNSTLEYLKSNAKFNIFSNAIKYLVLGMIEIIRYLIILYCLYLISKGNMEIGTVLLIYTYYSKIISNFEVLGTISAEYRSVKVSVNRINNIKKSI